MANVEGGASHRFAEAEIRRLARSRHQPDVLCFTLAHASKYNHKYKKWPLYCPQGSGTLRQQLLMMHGIAWYSMALHCIA